ncbi:PDZ and LIM domain protein 3-like [Diadema antillarum]|uniref:PDZ and LIM domain protein 3-like n=1 Tax=Diadema antillarum TaxID=105358 RepID=UPI003A8900DD
MTQMMDVTIPGPGPWGFRLAGGKDFNTPIHISKTTPNGKAAHAGLQLRDVVAAINGAITSSLTHFEAQDLIKAISGDLHLKIRRGGWVDSPTKASAASYDFPSAPPSAPIRRMEPEAVVPPSPSAQIVHKQFNSPVGLYSADNIADAFKGQVEGMGIKAGGMKYSPGGSMPSTPFGSGSVLHAKPKQAPMAQCYTPPARAHPASYGPPHPVNRPPSQPFNRPPPQPVNRPVSSGSYHPSNQSRSFKMLEDMTQEEEARAYSNMQQSHPSPASQYKSPIDQFEAYDSKPRGTQSRSFRMLQRFTADEEAMMDEM